MKDSGDGGTPDDGVTVISSGTVCPYETVTLAATNCVLEFNKTGNGGGRNPAAAVL